MKQLNTESTVLFQEREGDTDSDIVGSGHGMAVPYGTETNIGGMRESFAAGSFNLDDVIGKPLAYRHGEPVGKITGDPTHIVRANGTSSGASGLHLRRC